MKVTSKSGIARVVRGGEPYRSAQGTVYAPGISGEEVELWSGACLEHREVARPGDYLYIPADVPHVAVNRGATPAVFVGVRNEPTAQESLLMRPELDASVP